MEKHTTGGAGLLVMAGWAFLTGCGSTTASPGSSATAAMSPLLGTWDCSGPQVETCSGASHTDSFTFPMVLTATGVTTLATTLGADTFTFSSAGSTASLNTPLVLPTGPGSVGGTWTPTFSSGSVALAGANLLWNASGTAVYVNGISQVCGFTQSYTCSRGGGAAGAGVPVVDAGGGATVASTLDPALAGTWSYTGQFFYPDPAGTPGVNISNPPSSLLLNADGTYSVTASGVPLDVAGTWLVGATTPADWVQWKQQYNYPEKLTLKGSSGVTWDGYVDDGDPSGQTTGAASCLDLFYTQTQAPTGYYWLTFCHSVGTKR